MKQGLALCAAVIASGCFQGIKLPEGSQEANEYFVLRVPGGANEAKLTRDGMSGSEIQLTRYTDSLRGRAYGQTVELYWTQEEVKGTVGGSPVDLKVIQGKERLTIHGLYAGRVSDFTIQPDKLEGTFGLCTYSMTTQASGSYGGHVTCGGVPQEATLAIPPTLPLLYPAEIAAHLAVFLGQ
jgi:hypothetical protein